MRIIAGKFRGQKLSSFESDVIRPYTDRIKESVFSSLQFKIIHARVLDLFCGSGNIGLEAISRGAEFVQFNDLSKDSIFVLKKNIDKLKIDQNLFTISRLNAERIPDQGSLAFDLIFFDPPFAYESWNKLLNNYALAEWPTDPIFIVRHPKNITVNIPLNMVNKKEKKYGKSIIKYLEFKK